MSRKYLVLTHEGVRHRIDLRYLELLDAVMRDGSVAKASREVGITYKTALSRLRRLERLVRERLVISVKGGRSGGETKVTGRGEQLVKDYYAATSATRILAELAEKQRTQRQLAFQAAILDQVKNAVVATDLYGNITYWNKYAEQLYQYSAAEVLGKPMTEVTLAELETTPETVILNQVTREGYWTGEFVNRRKDRSTFPARGLISLVRGPDGEPLSIVRITFDITDLKLADEIKSRLAAIIESSDDAIIVLTADGRVTSWNKGAEEVYGYSTEEMVGNSIFVCVPENHQDELTRILNEVVRGERIRHFETQRIRKDGKLIDVSLTISPVKYPDGRVEVSTIARDITDRKRAEETLRASEARYRLISENSADVIYTVDLASLKVTFITPSVQRLLGYTPEEVREKSVADLLTPESYQSTIKKLGERVTALLAGDDSLRIYTRDHDLRRKDGSIVTMENTTTILTEDKGKPIGLVGVMRDVTHRRRVESESKKLLAAVESSPASIVITDDDGRIEYVNSKFSELTGYTLQEAKGQKPSILKSGYTPSEEYQKLWQTIIAGQEWHGEFLNRKKNGEYYWEDAIIAPVRNFKGEITHFVAVKEDITERKRMEETLTESEERFRSLVEYTSDWVWEVDANGTYTYCSPKVKELLGYEPEEILGRTPFELMPSDEAARVSAEFAGIVREARPFSQLENVNLHKSGRRVVLETSGVPLIGRDGRVRGYRGVDRDITERRTFESQLRESEERYRALFDNNPDAVLLTTPDGRILAANTSASQLFQQEEDELRRIGRNGIVDLTDPRVEDILRARTGLKGEFNFKRKDGTIFTGAVTSATFLDMHGQERNTMIIRDIAKE